MHVCQQKVPPSTSLLLLTESAIHVKLIRSLQSRTLVIREEIKTRILQHRGCILSFNAFFDDWKYMEALMKCLRPLLP